MLYDGDTLAKEGTMSSFLSKYKKAEPHTKIKTNSQVRKTPRQKFIEGVQEQLEIFRADREGIKFTKTGRSYTATTQDDGSIAKVRTNKELRIRRWWAEVRGQILIEARYGQRLLLEDLFVLDSLGDVETFLKDLISAANAGEFDNLFDKFKRNSDIPPPVVKVPTKGK